MQKTDAPLKAGKAADIDAFGKAVYGHDFPEAVTQLVSLLKAVKHGWAPVGFARFEQAHFTQIAAAVTALFSAPKFKLSQAGFDTLCCDYATIDAIFKASGFGNSEHVFGLIREDAEGLTKYLLMFPLDSVLNLDIEEPLRKDPQAMLGWWLAMISHPQIFSERSHARRERLLELAHMFEDVELPRELLNLLVGAYMHISYASSSDKHRPKATFHRLLRKMIAPEVQENHAPLVHKDRPTVLVCLEWWWSSHAMYRCYAKSVEQLKERFRLVGMGRGETVNKEATAMFDEFVELGNDSIFLLEVAEKIKKINPDIIYYPSIGMSIWTIAMASLRLAPLQVMSYGHPATTYSPAIDYGLIESDAIGKAEMSESLVKLPPEFMRHVKPKGEYAKHTPKRGQPIQIAIPAMHCKVSWPFVQALQSIEAKAPRPVTFHFFPYVGGAGMYQFGRQIEPLVQNKVVNERAQYREYMSKIAECDIALFSFPFGGTNSTVDACLAGLPMVAFEGDEIHSRTDAMIMRRAKLPEWLIAQSVEGYVDAVLKLFDDDVRAEVAAEIRAADLDSTIFAQDGEKAFLNAFLDIYGRHALKAAA